VSLHRFRGTPAGYGRFRRRTGAEAGARPRRKHLRLDQSKIDRARKILGARTEQETVEQALDMVLAEHRIQKAHRRVKAVGGLEDAFG
jgi:hypothetical protein